MATKLEKVRTLLSLLDFEKGLQEEMASLAPDVTGISMTEEEILEASVFQQKLEQAVARFREAVEKIHLELFSEEELDQLIAFLESPTGRRFIELLPEIGEKSADAHDAAFDAAFEEDSAEEDSSG